MSDNKELLPCPFCGGEAKLKVRATRMVNCNQCSASTFEPHDDEFGALKEWNRRAAQPVVLTDEHVRAAGGIVHKDGNIFFTNIGKLNAAILAAKEQAK